MRSARILDDLERIGGSWRHCCLLASRCRFRLGHGGRVVSSKNMPAIPRKCSRSPRNVRRPLTIPNGSSWWTTMSIRPTLKTCCGRFAHAVTRPRTWTFCAILGRRARSESFPPEVRPYGSKVLINACKPHRHLTQFPQSTLLRRSVHDRVVARWPELGFTGTPRKMTAFHDE